MSNPKIENLKKLKNYHLQKSNEDDLVDNKILYLAYIFEHQLEIDLLEMKKYTQETINRKGKELKQILEISKSYKKIQQNVLKSVSHSVELLNKNQQMMLPKKIRGQRKEQAPQMSQTFEFQGGVNEGYGQDQIDNFTDNTLTNFMSNVDINNQYIRRVAGRLVANKFVDKQKQEQENKLQSEQQRAVILTKQIKNLYNQGGKNLIVKGNDRKSGEKLFYTIVIDKVLKQGKFDDQHVYDLMKSFIKDPVNFDSKVKQQYRNNAVKEYDILNDFHSDEYENFEVEDALIDIGYNADYSEVGLDIKFFSKISEHSQFEQLNSVIYENECFYNSLFFYGIDDNSAIGIHKFEDIIQYLESHQLNFKIVKDDLSFITKQYLKEGLEEPTLHEFKGKETPFRQIKPVIQTVYENKSFEGRGMVFAIKLQSEKNHIFIPKAINYFVNQQMSNVMIIKNGKMQALFKVDKQKLQKRHIFYDLETIEDPKKGFQFKAISISISYIDEGEKKIWDYSEEELFLTLFMKTKCVVSYNLNIYDEIFKSLSKDRYNIIWGFNSSKFDNIFLMRSMIENGYKCEISIQNGMMELSDKSSSKQYQFETKDLRRFLGPGSLEWHSENYIKNKLFRKKKVEENEQKLSFFDELQDRYNNGILENQDEFMKKLVDYNNLDVNSLALILRSQTSILNSLIQKGMIEKYYECVSIPHFMYKLFMSSNKDIKCKPQKFKEFKGKKGDEIEEKKVMLRLLEYFLLSSYKTGGRCDLNKKIIMDTISSMDVCSLYPFIMLCYKESYFMVGKMLETNEFVEGKPGIYFGNITQERRNDEMLFYCDKSGEVNDFNNENKIDVVMTSHEINYFRKEKSHWKVQIKFGFYTEKSIKGCDLFKVMLPFIREKCRQDELKMNKSEEYNHSVRELCKTMMNSLSGKFLQASKDTEYYLDDQLRISSRKLDMDTYKKKLIKGDKQLHVGIFIYSLSKLYMWKYTYGQFSRSEFTMTDTDSNKYDSVMMKKWIEKFGVIKMKDIVFPECFKMNIGFNENTLMYYSGDGVKCLGQFEDEYAGENFNCGIFAGKKEYMVYNEKEYKCLIKGIDKNNFVLLDIDKIWKDDNYKVNIVRKRDQKKITLEEYFKNEDVQDEYGLQIKVNIKDDTIENIFKQKRGIDEICKKNDKKQEQLEQIMRNKIEGKKSYVLTSCFKKNFKELKVEKQYMIKCL